MEIMKKEDLEGLKKRIEREVEDIETKVGLDKFWERYLGEGGRLSLILSRIKDLSEKEKRVVGKKANEVKVFLERKVEEKKRDLETKMENRKRIDVTVPGKRVKTGHLHPLTQVRRKMMLIFQNMGFEIAQGPEVEGEWYNFEALNIPENHPARDMWDTFWLQGSQKNQKYRSKRLLMRTHTSPVQIRYMEKNQPPIRIIVPGKVFRHEKRDASHEFQLYHLEGLMVGKKINTSHFKAVVTTFLRRFFGKDLDIRMRPSFFPFTEPSFEIDVECVVCGGEGEVSDRSGPCSTCSGTGWLEIMGAGMVHPKVFDNVGFNPENVQGFAFGLGMDRLAMMKYRIPNIRWLHSGDLRFLNQF